MTAVEAKIIADQTKLIYEQLQVVSKHRKALQDIHKKLICIGGPLNDNFLQYSNEQLRIFFAINNICKEVLKEEEDDD